MTQSFVAETSDTNAVKAFGATNGVYEWLHCSIRFAVNIDAKIGPCGQKVVEQRNGISAVNPCCFESGPFCFFDAPRLATRAL
jgi:hypothetical protein